jgi:hypothetical protein
MHALLNGALPVFGIILAGYLVGRLRLLGRRAAITMVLTATVFDLLGAAAGPCAPFGLG